MNVTVADCLRLPTLREAQLVAGAKGLDRAVSSVSVLEWPETNLLSDELIVGNELVISALVTIKDDVARQCCVLRHLRSMGAAGLVLFYVGVFIPQIDDALIAVADEINLPLIAMPFGRMDFRYSDMITDIVEYIGELGQRKNKKGILLTCRFLPFECIVQQRLCYTTPPGSRPMGDCFNQLWC